MIESMSYSLDLRNAAFAAAAEKSSSLSTLDDDEFVAFYERTSKALWAYLSRMTGNRDQADDLLQEAYYRFYKASKSHESESHRRNSLFRIATNLVHDAGRRKRYRTDIGVSEEPTEEMVLAVSTDQLPDESVEVRTDLTRAMSQLDATQRQLLWLAYVQGNSHDEIAETLGLKSVSIRTMLLRARRKLASILSAREKAEEIV